MELVYESVDVDPPSCHIARMTSVDEKQFYTSGGCNDLFYLRRGHAGGEYIISLGIIGQEIVVLSTSVILTVPS